jgi:ribosomal protein L32
MAVPKRRKSKSRTRKGRNAHEMRKVAKAVKTKDGKAFKRAHIEERIEL